MGRRTLAATLSLALLGAAAPAWARPAVDRRELLGASVQGRPIRVFELGTPGTTTVLVIGCVHGDECAGTRIARSLLESAPPSFADLWVLPNVNPDGRALDRRGNAHGVDLNRNFPYGWEPIPRGRYCAGPRPLSEPESRLAAALIRRIEPDITIWFHQPFGVVDLSGGDGTIERRYARLVGLPVERLGRYPGSASRWQNHAFPRSTAFVVELPGGSLSDGRARRYANAVLELLAPAGAAADRGRGLRVGRPLPYNRRRRRA